MDIESKDIFASCGGAPSIGRVLGGDVSALGNSFDWSKTIQGHGYWRDRYNGLEELSLEDKQYLLGLINYNGG